MPGEDRQSRRHHQLRLRDEVVLLTEITPPAHPAAGRRDAQGEGDWLVCAEICVPGSAELALEAADGGDAQPANAEVFGKYRALLAASRRREKRRAVKSSAAKRTARNCLTFEFSTAPAAAKPQDARIFPAAGRHRRGRSSRPVDASCRTGDRAWMATDRPRVTSGSRGRRRSRRRAGASDGADGKRTGVGHSAASGGQCAAPASPGAPASTRPADSGRAAGAACRAGLAGARPVRCGISCCSGSWVG